VHWTAIYGEKIFIVYLWPLVFPAFVKASRGILHERVSDAEL
jgi:hypothetical protein